MKFGLPKQAWRRVRRFAWLPTVVRQYPDDAGRGDATLTVWLETYEIEQRWHHDHWHEDQRYALFPFLG